jgi:MFS family permease
MSARQSPSPPTPGWSALLRRDWLLTLAILLGGVLLQSMNVLVLATVLPSIVGELGGVAMLSWPTTAYLAASIVAASCAPLSVQAFGGRAAYCAGVAAFGAGALVCSLAPDMGWIVAGRVLQGFGGGVEAAVAYVLVRRTFPETIWPRALALMSSSWTVSVLLGPLIGGAFASFGHWRGAFIATAAIAAVLSVSARFVLSAAHDRVSKDKQKLPAGRIALICAAIAGVSLASTAGAWVAEVGLLLAAVAALAVLLKLDRAAASPMFPRDAFALSTETGVGLWLALLLCISYGPLQIYVPLFLQRLHGLDPLSAGFIVASASLTWTAASLVTAGASDRRSNRLILTGPLVMGLGQLLIAVFIAREAWWLAIPGILALGVGIGQCWPFVAHRVMRGARSGEDTTAAAAVPTVQQMGFAFGAALAGLSANANGLAGEATREAIAHASFWVPASFLLPATLALVAAARLLHVPLPLGGEAR